MNPQSVLESLTDDEAITLAQQIVDGVMARREADGKRALPSLSQEAMDTMARIRRSMRRLDEESY